MSDKLKKIFKKKKADVKFKRAESGHRLNKGTTTAKTVAKPGEPSPVYRVVPTDEANQIAAAALARFQSKKTTTGPLNVTTLAAIKSRARKEMEAERKNVDQNIDAFAHSEEENTSAEIPGQLATSDIFFQCPMIVLEVFSQQEWHIKIEKFIKEQMKDDPLLLSILLIPNYNHKRKKVEECIKLLVTYAENIIRNKKEGNYLKVRLMNKTFMEKVLSIKGAIEFLESIGFVRKKLMYQEQEDFLVFPEECLYNLASVQSTADDLQSAESIQLVFDRNVHVLLLSQASKQVSLPSELFIVSTAEIKTEHQKRTEKLEGEMILKINIMRMKEQNRCKSNYKYCLILVKFPDCLISQGAFGVNKHLSDTLEFVKESVFDEERFKLILSSGIKFGNGHENMTLSKLNLVLTTVLLFTNDQSKNNKDHPYLIDELMALVQ